MKGASARSSGPKKCRASCRSTTAPPMVTMMMRSGLSPAIGRTARSSKTAPMAAVAAIAATAATGSGSPSSVKDTPSMPPSMKNSPCAKLIAPVAAYTIVKPSATSA